METFNAMSKHIEISRELENINFKELRALFPDLKGSQKEISEITRPKNQNRWFLNNKVHPADKKKDNEPKTQLEAFQQAMKLLFTIGQCLGLNPIAGILVTDASKMRFSVFNWRFLHCIVICLAQAIMAILIIYRITKIPLTVAALGLFAFYITTSITTILYLYMGTKWPGLMKELENSSLNEYIDRSVKTKCYTACIVIFFLAAVEHVLSLISKLTSISDCSSNIDVYGEYQKRTFAWYYALGLPDGKAVAVVIQIMNIISTLNWSYSDVYICCLSFYLVSILQKINKKVVLASEKHFLPPKYWRSLREDYCKATRLVHSFDDVISGIVFSSLASNLIFICLQLYNVLKIFEGNEYTVYMGFSVIYLLARSLAVSLIAAYVHSASLAPAAALYNVPSASYCTEVARFLDQVHTDTVALSGLNFFYVTRELVLSPSPYLIGTTLELYIALRKGSLKKKVVGTIVTYELVVLQVSDDGTA